MEQNQYVEYLLHFGLTRQEALIYVELLVKGKQTGYEIAKETGISRSNVYSVLAALAEKGAGLCDRRVCKALYSGKSRGVLRELYPQDAGGAGVDGEKPSTEESGDRRIYHH